MACDSDVDDHEPVYLWPQPDMGVLRLNRRPPPGLPLRVFEPAWEEWIVTAAKADSGLYVDPQQLLNLPANAAAGDVTRAIVDHLVDGDLTSADNVDALVEFVEEIANRPPVS